MNISASERRQAFSVWLRTGRLPAVQTADGLELKYNPWHDWQTGRFTFAGTGRYSGGWLGGGFRSGGGGSFGGSGYTSRLEEWPDKRPKAQALRSGAAQPSRRAASPKPAAAIVRLPDFPRRTDSPQPPHRAASPIPPSASRKAPASPRRQPVTPEFRHVVRNGYEYQIDKSDRTRRVSGTLTLSVTRLRSRASQTRAGDADRRSSDDGGHYIAARFNGPTEAFNHFAQDSNFNRGGYRVLEDKWAAATKSGKRVSVRITPSYDGASKRPAAIHVSFSVDGVKDIATFPNQRLEKPRGKR